MFWSDENTSIIAIRRAIQLDGENKVQIPGKSLLRIISNISCEISARTTPGTSIAKAGEGSWSSLCEKSLIRLLRSSSVWLIVVGKTHLAHLDTNRTKRWLTLKRQPRPSLMVDIKD